MHTVHRLYDTFHPASYQLSLTIDRIDRTFHGTVGITGTYMGGAPLAFHAKDLTIIQARLDHEGTELPHLEKDDELVFDVDLAPGEHHVLIEFSGIITDPMHGLYPCYYEHDGQKKELLATQFESHHAREVFPCIDEPEAKATFDLTLTTETGVQVLGNMPIKESRVTSHESQETQFETTPRMSPYLLAFVVGELHKKSSKTKSGVEVNVWATPAQAPESLDFALETATRAIEFFDDYFGAPYPLPKADHVALPDFTVGAMENWGLITYREVCLLADQNTSVSSRQHVAVVITHETSHQWFGNLVTMKWWDDLWLNESFATLMEYLAVDHLFPSWNIWMTFATNETLSAMRRDYLPSVQPVKMAVHHPDEINTLFDPSIVYAKGARLLTMLHRYIGDDAFRAGLAHYFQEYAYSNTTGQDLWDALSTASHHDIASFMTPWLTQPGLPIVHIDRTSVRQERFVLGGDNPTPEALWPIPLASNQPSLPELLIAREEPYKLASDETKINEGGECHFVTHYADENMLASRIAAIADGSETDPRDRLTLLNDATLLARSGDITATNLFELALSYQNETNEPVWGIIALVISDLKRFVEASAIHEKKFKHHVAQLASHVYKRLGWSDRADEDESDTKLRAIALSLLIYTDDETIIKKGLATFRATPDLVDIPGELRALIFVIVAKHGTDDEFQHLIDAHKATHLAELQRDIAASLTGATDPARITTLIGLLMQGNIIRPQDTAQWFGYLIRNHHARAQTWEWLTTHWGWIESIFAGDLSYEKFVRFSASGFSTDEWLAHYRDFFGPKKSIPALTRAIELGESDIIARAEWLKRDKTAFIEKL